MYTDWRGADIRIVTWGVWMYLLFSVCLVWFADEFGGYVEGSGGLCGRYFGRICLRLPIRRVWRVGGLNRSSRYNYRFVSVFDELIFRIRVKREKPSKPSNPPDWWIWAINWGSFSGGLFSQTLRTLQKTFHERGFVFFVFWWWIVTEIFIRQTLIWL